MAAGSHDQYLRQNRQGDEAAEWQDQWAAGDPGNRPCNKVWPFSGNAFPLREYCESEKHETRQQYPADLKKQKSGTACKRACGVLHQARTRSHATGAGNDRGENVRQIRAVTLEHEAEQRDEKHRQHSVEKGCGAAGGYCVIVHMVKMFRVPWLVKASGPIGYMYR